MSSKRLPDRTVRFSDDDHTQTSPRSRDSGIGSSNDQAHVGGRSDRRFTAEDFNRQYFNVHALQEALESCNQSLQDTKRKNFELDGKLTEAHKSLREKEATNRALHDENDALRQTIETQDATIKDLKSSLHACQQGASSTAGGAYLMSGGSGEPVDGVRRSRSARHSKQDSLDLKDRMKERINKGNPESEVSSSASSTRSRGKEHENKASLHRSTSRTRKPYIEETPTQDRREKRDKGPPPSTRGFDQINYTTSPASSSTSRHDTAAMSPRTSYSSIQYGAPAYTTTGDYYQESLPPKEPKYSKSGKHKQ